MGLIEIEKQKQRQNGMSEPWKQSGSVGQELGGEDRIRTKRFYMGIGGLDGLTLA